MTMEKINGLIIGGRVYVNDPLYVSCYDNCALRDSCQRFEEKHGEFLCVAHGATERNDFGYRFDPELTDKLNEI